MKPKTKMKKKAEQAHKLAKIVIDNNEVSTSVLVLRADNHSQKDRNFYLGKHRWGNETEVKIIGD